MFNVTAIVNGKARTSGLLETYSDAAAQACAMLRWAMEKPGRQVTQLRVTRVNAWVAVAMIGDEERRSEPGSFAEAKAHARRMLEWASANGAELKSVRYIKVGA